MKYIKKRDTIVWLKTLCGAIVFDMLMRAINHWLFALILGIILGSVAGTFLLFSYLIIKDTE